MVWYDIGDEHVAEQSSEVCKEGENVGQSIFWAGEKVQVRRIS